MPVKINTAGWDFFWQNFMIYCDGMIFFLYYLIALFYFYYKKKKRKLFVYPFLLELITIFNPLFMYHILLQSGWSTRYYRFFWIIPVGIVLAYASEELIARHKGKTKILYILLILCAFLSLRHFITLNIISPNIYKIDPEVIQISELLHNDNKNKNIYVFYPMNLVYSMRQYDASLISPVGRGDILNVPFDESLCVQNIENNTELKLMANYPYEMEIQTFKSALARNNIQYYIVQKDWLSQAYRNSLDFILIGETINYYVYRCQ